MDKRLFQIRIPEDRIDEVCMALYDLGYKWGGGHCLRDVHFKHHGRNTYYSIYADHVVRYGSIGSDRLRIYEVDEFLQEFCGVEDDSNLNIESIL